MKIIDNILYLELTDAIQCGFGDANYISKEKSRGAKWGIFIKDPQDKRKILIEFDSLHEKKKDQVLKTIGNPYEVMAKEPIKKMVVKDLKAEDFFLHYRYDDDKKLTPEAVKEYTTAASWLNMLVKADQNKSEIKKQLGLSITNFFLNVCEIIEKENIKLPSSYRFLKPKINQYKSEGYQCLIKKGLGKKNNLKVRTETAQSFLLNLLSIPYHDDHVVCRAYNKWAVENNEPQISPKTVGNWRNRHSFELTGDREGSKVWYNIFGKQIMRRRPSAPLLLVNSDDNDLDLYFIETSIDKKGRSKTNYYHRPVLIVIIDAFNDYILGYSIADEISADLVRLAYLDAIHHIHDLTGGWYLPIQGQTDRWGNGTLDSFYDEVFQVYTPATARLPRAKYIERSFGTQWHQQLKYYTNYAGHNITAKTRLNEDHLQLVKKEFPNKEHAMYQAEDFINKMRNLINEKTGKTKQQEWLEAFEKSDLSKSRAITDMQMLHKLGTEHPYLNTITNKGITITIDDRIYNYEIPDDQYLQNVNRKVQVIYDPMDMSRVLVTDGNNLRFIAKSYKFLPSAIADFQPGDRARLNARLDEKKRHVEFISKRKEQRDILLSNKQINPASYLQAGVTSLPKEQKRMIEDAYHNRGENKDEHFDPIDLM